MLLAGGISFVPVPTSGWPSAFFAGVIPACLVWVFRFGMPESPRWFMIKNDPVQAEAQLQRIEAGVERDIGRPLPEAKSVGAIHSEKGAEYSMLFRPLYGSLSLPL